MNKAMIALFGFLLISAYCLCQTNSSWNYVDHLDKSNQIDFLHPYQGGLIYVKSGKSCYRPSTIMFVDAIGQPKEIYSSYFFVGNCQFHDNTDGSVSILLSDLIEYDVGLGGIIKVDFDGQDVEVTGAPADIDNFVYNLNSVFHFSNDTLWTVGQIGDQLFSDTTLKDVTIIEYRVDQRVYSFSPVFFNESKQLFTIGSYPEYDIMVLDNLTARTVDGQVVYNGNFRKVNDTHDGVDFIYRIGVYNVATSNDAITVYSSSFKESLFTIATPDVGQHDYKTKFYVNNDELFIRFPSEAPNESQIWKLNVVDQEWELVKSEILADENLFYQIETETSEITISNINEDMHIYIEKVPLQESIDFPPIPVRLTKATYKVISVSDERYSNGFNYIYAVAATVINEGSSPINILNIDSNLELYHCAGLYMQFEGVLESNQEIELLDTVNYTSTEPFENLELFISGANYKRVDDAPITADFITASENVQINPLSIYPNPATNSITVDIDKGNDLRGGPITQQF